MRLYVSEDIDDDRIAVRWSSTTALFRRLSVGRDEFPSRLDLPAALRQAADRVTPVVAAPATPRIALGVLVAVWAVTFLTLGWLRHARFTTYGFDVGIFDQAVWLLAHGHEPFVTIRGLHVFGNHANFVLLLLLPFYRLGAGPHFLLAVQVASLAFGAVAVYGLTRTWSARPWIAVAVAAALLLHPAYQYLVWEHFQPETLAVGPLLGAVWAASRQRWGWYALATAVALICKENVALAVLMLGVVIAVRGHRRVGLLTSAVAAGYFLLMVQVAIPTFAGGGPFYQDFFPQFGSSVSGVVGGILSRPGQVIELATQPDRLRYLWQMVAPFGLVLPLLALPYLLVAAPQLLINVLVALPYAREIRWHHTALVLVGLIAATAGGVAALRRRPRLQAAAAVGVVVSALAGSVAWGPSPLGREFESGLWPLRPDPRVAAKETAVAAVPPEGSVSASYSLVPHLSHRRQVYEFPVPWTSANWGLGGEGLHDPRGVRWLAVDRTLLGPEDSARLESLLEEDFVIRLEQDGIVVAERGG